MLLCAVLTGIFSDGFGNNRGIDEVISDIGGHLLCVPVLADAHALHCSLQSVQDPLVMRKHQHLAPCKPNSTALAHSEAE